MRRRAASTRSMAGLAVIAGLIVGCGIPPSGTARTVAWTVGDTNLTLAPPGGRGNMRLSSLDAYQRCLGGASCASGSPTAIELAVAIDPGTNIIPPEGTLVWAIEWLDIVCPPSRGGGPVVGPAPPPADPGRCDEIALVDASTGVFLFTQTAPHDPNRP